MTVAETIKEITRDHLLNHNGVAMGQCLTAVGGVGNSVPVELTEAQGLLEFSMDDTSGAGIANGYALAGRRPIYIVRYQGFQWIDGWPLVNYAAKSKEMWGIPCPVFIRSVAMEGAIGPVAGSSHHGMFIRMPGIKVFAPMTPIEYTLVWDHFMTQTDPVYVSEHRRSFPIDYEMSHNIADTADITLFAISVTRLAAVKAAEVLKKEGIYCNVIHLIKLKPFLAENYMVSALATSVYGGIVLDSDFENGASKCIAFDLMQTISKKVRVMGLEERAAGFAPHLDNLPPSEEKICRTVRDIVKNNRQ